MGKSFKIHFPNIYDFYLIAALTCYLYFIAQGMWNTVVDFFFWPSLLLLALNFARNETWVASRILWSRQWCVETFSTFTNCSKINFNHVLQTWPNF